MKLPSVVGTLFVPDRALPETVAAGRYGAALVCCTLAALLAALLIGRRLDVSQTVDGMNDGVAKTEREFDDSVAKAKTVAQVTMALGAAFGTPAHLLLLAIGLYLVGRYVGGKPTFRRSLALASHMSLPLAVKSLFAATVALRTLRIVPSEIPSLAPLAGRLLDPYWLWAAILCALGWSAAADMSRRRAVFATGYCLVILVAVSSLGGST